MKMSRRIVSFALSLMMFITVIPFNNVTVYASEDDILESGADIVTDQELTEEPVFDSESIQSGQEIEETKEDNIHESRFKTKSFP